MEIEIDFCDKLHGKALIRIIIPSEWEHAVWLVNHEQKLLRKVSLPKPYKICLSVILSRVLIEPQIKTQVQVTLTASLYDTTSALLQALSAVKPPTLGFIASIRNENRIFATSPLILRPLIKAFYFIPFTWRWLRLRTMSIFSVINYRMTSNERKS